MNNSNAITYLDISLEIVAKNIGNNGQRCKIIREREFPLMSFQPGIPLEKSEENQRQADQDRYAGVLA